MTFIEGVAAGVVSNTLYGVFGAAWRALSRRHADWDRALLHKLSVSGVELTRDEGRRLVQWIRSFDVEALAAAAAGEHQDLAESLRREVLLDPAGSLESFHSERRSEDLAASLWEVLGDTLDPRDLIALKAGIAATYTDQRVSSVLEELGWLRENLELPPLIDPALPLERAWLRPLPGAPISPYQLLWARSGVVPFLDRGAWLDDLLHWCDETDRMSVRIVHGSGGMGKTRLALELCRRVSSRGWLAGLYRSSRESALKSLADERVRRLVVIDYADLQPEVARLVIDRLSDRLPLRHERVRVLLVVRRTGRRRDPRRWFTGPADRVTQLIDSAGLLALSENPALPGEAETQGVLFDVSARVELYERSVEAFAGYFPVRNRPARPPLEASVYNSPLSVLMAALIAVDSSNSRSPMPATMDELMDRVLEREQRIHWTGSPEPTLELQQRAVTISTLFGADDEDEAIRQIAAEPAWAHDVGMQTRVALWLHGLYEGPRWLNPLEPDLLGEYLVGVTLDRALIERVVASAASSSAVRAFTVLSHMIGSRPQLRDLVTEVLRPELGTLAHAAVDEVLASPLGTGERLMGPLTAVVEQLDLGANAIQLPLEADTRITGNPLAVVLGSQAVEYARNLVDLDGTPAERNLLASSLSNLSDRLGELGRTAESVAASLESVAIRRDLVEEGWLRAEVVVSALTVLSARLGDIGRWSEAKTEADEAVAIARRLAREDPTRHRAALAASLSNLSLALGELGYAQDRLTAIEEAVLIRRELAADGSDAALAYLADSINNQSNSLAELGRPGEAVQASEEVVAIRRVRARDDPAQLKDLADALHNLSIHLAAADTDPSAATSSAREAVAIYQEVADQNPEGHLRTLVQALNTLALRQEANGDVEDALSSASEAVATQRSLAAESPSAELSRLAMVLNTQSNILGLLGRSEEALAAVHEAVLTLRRASESEPDLNAEYLAATLNNLSVRQAEAERYDEALSTIEEAVLLRRQLAAGGLAPARNKLAEILRNQSIALSRVGRLDAAVVSIEEAVSIRRELFGADAAQHQEAFRRELATLSRSLAAVGRAEEAAEFASEASSL